MKQNRHLRYCSWVLKKIIDCILDNRYFLLDVMNNTSDLNALKVPPGNRLKELEPPRKGTWSVRINDQWRITFKFHDGDFFDVKIEDYH